MTKSEIAEKKFKEGFNCAQSVLFSYADELGLSRDLALRIANGFGGGMGRKQEVCGAVSGGIMVLGLKYGRGENEGKEKQELTYQKVRELIDAFVNEYGTMNCRELLSGCVLLSPEGQKQFSEKKLITRCHEYVRFVCDVLERIV
jgi:C_GCAxxG_C_C family probable redox protein